MFDVSLVQKIYFFMLDVLSSSKKIFSFLLDIMMCRSPTLLRKKSAHFLHFFCFKVPNLLSELPGHGYVCRNPTQAHVSESAQELDTQNPSWNPTWSHGCRNPTWTQGAACQFISVSSRKLQVWGF